VGDVLHIDGEAYTVRQRMGDQVMCSVEEEDGAGDWETLSVADAEAMLRAERGEATHAPSPDVRLVRDMWVRRGGRARVHAVKFMWGLFACGDLFHRRFGRGDGRCGECPDEAETAWHVLGECGAGGAREMRHKWAERMWTEVSAELTHEYSPLDARVANAVRRLWSLDECERLQSWAPGTAGPAAGAGLDGNLQRLLANVAKAGSWSVWMGVFDRGWMELLQAGGMSYARARRLTKRLCNVIRESKSEIARARNERQRQERQRSREAQELELNEAVRQRRAARMAMMAERGERQRQAARALRRQEGRRERRGRRR
jgi:hypothetical protein